MKILFFHDDCETMGGADTYRRGLCRILQTLGHKIYLFTMRPCPYENDLSYSYTLRSGNKAADHFTRHYLHLPLYFAIRKIIKEIKPDIIHIHSNDLFPNSVLLACGTTPVVQTLHDCKMVCPTWNGVKVSGVMCEKGFGTSCYKDGCISFYRYISQWIWRKINLFLVKTRVNALIAPSMALNRVLLCYGLEPIHIPNYTDTSKYLLSDSIPDGKKILCACYLSPSKGVKHLISAFKKVLLKIPSAILDIAGDGPEKQYLEKLCASLNVQNSVIFHGIVPHDKLPEFYGRANIVVLPSVVAENCPLVLLEAMASGKAVIGSRIGGIPEIVAENETGLLYNPYDDIELSEKIIQLLSDPKKTWEMGKSGKKRVEKKFSADKHISQILDLYSTVSRAEKIKSNEHISSEGCT